MPRAASAPRRVSPSLFSRVEDVVTGSLLAGGAAVRLVALLAAGAPQLLHHRSDLQTRNRVSTAMGNGMVAFAEESV